jgi:hypothetical protein
MTNFAYISGNPDNLTGGGAANMVDIQGPLVDLATWLNTDLQPRVAAAVPTFVTSLPVSAVDGQEIYYQADATNGIVWHLRYNAGSASTYKWEFIGGSSLSADVPAQPGGETSASTTYADVATVGPQITVPLAGEYLVGVQFEGWNTSAVSFNIYAAPKFGAAATADADAAITGGTIANIVMTASRQDMRRTIAVAATVVKAQYKVTGGTGVYRNRTLTVKPVRVG